MAGRALKNEQIEASESTLKLVRLEAFIIVIITRFPRQEASCVLQFKAATIRPLLGLARSKQDPINRGQGAQHLFRPPPCSHVMTKVLAEACLCCRLVAGPLKVPKYEALIAEDKHEQLP